jgi:hypothetical protein
MQIGKRAATAAPRRTRPRAAFRPAGERLEGRALLAAIDLINIAGNDTPAGPGPYGVQEVGINNDSGTGWSVAELGDVNGDGFDDFLLGAPTILPNTAVPQLGVGNGTVYLIFGSADVTAGTVNWLTLNAQQRIGDLGQLGNTSQTNPVNGQPGFNFDGLTFVAGQNPQNLLGASVAGVGDVNGDGLADFMIGAPLALDVNNLASTGRAYLVYGSTALSTRTNKLVDLDNATGIADLNVMTFVNDTVQAGSLTGLSVGAVGNVFGDGFPAIAVGAPNASLNGLSGNGAAYVVAGGFLRPARTETVNLANVGQGGANPVPGMIFAGALSGDQAGASVSTAGDFDADGVSDILLGATQQGTSTGEAYVIYGSTSLAGQGIVTQGVNNISLSRIGTTGTNAVPGAVFLGEFTNDLTGFSVNTAGDFNADGVSDILIGSPQWNGPSGLDSGRVSMIFGRRATPTTPGRIVGTFNLSSLPSGIDFVELDGASAAALAGFSVSPVGFINNDTINEILIGSPGFNSGRGAVYLIPGNPDLLGTFNLTNIQANPLVGTIITLSQPQGTNFLGTSVSGRLGTGSPTIDADSVADFIVGATGYTLSGRAFAGTGYALEGALVPLATPVSNAITSPIGVDTVSPPFVISQTQDSVTIFILSANSNTPGFTPPDDIDPNTIAVNGVALPDPSSFQNAGDLDGDGIDDASFVFSPLSLLNLSVGTTTFTVTARTLASSPFPNRRYSGSASVQVRGAPTPPPQPFVPLTFGTQFQNLNAAAPRFGERFLPQPNVIGRPRWAPLSIRMAYRQFLPQGAFGFRLRNAFHPDAQMQKRKVGPTRTLERQVFTRGRFQPGVHFGRVNHKGPVVGNGLPAIRGLTA